MKLPELDIKLLPKYIKRISNSLNKYLVIIFVLFVLSVYAFLVIKISSSAQQEPDQSSITAEASNIKRLKVDQESVDKIESLKDQNVVVQSLFESARNNPFQE